MSELKVYYLPGLWGLVSLSPFCLKLDSYLRMTGIEHETIIATGPFGGPKKKAPWIEYKGSKLGDSTFIIDFLNAEFGKDPDAQLSAEQRATGVAVQRLVEENLYWAMVYDRWLKEENWPMLKNSVLSRVPAIPRAVLAPLVRRNIRKQVNGHGLGLHSAKEIEAITAKDIAALAGILGDKDWFLGAQISMTDATVYSLLANIAFTDFKSPMKAMIKGHSNLSDWLMRYRDKVYPAD